MDRTSPSWLLQKDGSFCCELYALCNALRFFGRSSPEPGTDDWKSLVDDIGCRYGCAIRTKAVASSLGLKLDLVSWDSIALSIPVIVIVPNPGIGSAYHSTLVVASFGEQFDVVNYRVPSGPVIERIYLMSLPRAPSGLRGPMSVSLKCG